MIANHSSIWAVVPVKDTAQAKQRLTARLSAGDRQILALAMLEDVLAALSDVPQLDGIIVVTVDSLAADIATRHGAVVSEIGAHDGHTGAVMAAARRLCAEGKGMLAIPGDVPLVTSGDIQALIAAHNPAPSFTIVPARDFQGSNAILMSPANAVPLRFGENSFYPHLAAAKAAGIAPVVHRCPAIELDIDTPEDFAAFEGAGSRASSATLIARWDRENAARAAKAAS